MSEKYYCPFISLDGEYTSNRCMASQCMFWDGKGFDSQAYDNLLKYNCVLVRAAHTLSTQER